MDKSLREERVLLAEANSFPASYVGNVVEASGAIVSGPFADAGEILVWLRDTAHLPSAAVLSVEMAEASGGMLAAQLEAMRIPFVLVQESARIAAEVAATFTWPFAGFQIVEALIDLVQLPRESGEK